MSTLQFSKSLPLSSQEIAFRTIVQKCGDQLLILPNCQTILKDLNSIDYVFSSDVLAEDSFIPDCYDVAVHRHGRYAPAISHSHDFIEVVYVLSGTFVNYIDTVSLTLYPGDVCIIGRHTPHALGGFQDDCICYNLMIRASTFEKVFMGILPENDILSAFILETMYSDRSASYLYFPTGIDQNLLRCFNSIFTEYQLQEPYSRHMLNTLVSMFFIQLLRHYRALAVTGNPSKNGSANYNISTILYYMQQHSDTLTLKDLAGLFHYSDRHLRRILREYTGLSFSKLIKKIRMQKTADLLQNTSLSVSDIANRIGYKDLTFFYQIFKSTYGVTPAEYRKNHK